MRAVRLDAVESRFGADGRGGPEVGDDLTDVFGRNVGWRRERLCPVRVGARKATSLLPAPERSRNWKDSWGSLV